jgi:hypothetical protein
MPHRLKIPTHAFRMRRPKWKKNGEKKENYVGAKQ